MPSDFTDDLRLAHVLADDADSLSTARFKALDLHVMTKPDLTPVTDADQAVEDGHPAHALASPPTRRRPRRGERLDRTRPAALGGRPDRRDQELRPRRPCLGDPDLADGRGRGGRRRRLGTDAQPPLVGDEGRRRLDRQVAAASHRVPGLRRLAGWRTPRCPTPRSGAGRSAAGSTTSSSLSRRCWRTRAYGDFWSYMLLAEGAVDIATEPELELYDMAALDVIVREAGGRVHLPGRRARTRRVATRWPPTASCTTRRWPSSARSRTTTTPRRGLARCTT